MHMCIQTYEDGGIGTVNDNGDIVSTYCDSMLDLFQWKWGPEF